jgi:hypothetical protein
MGLSRDLYDSDMTFHCPGCETAVVRKGLWIKSARVFVCDTCDTQTALTYGLKLAIFDAHLHSDAPLSLSAYKRS